MDYGRKKDSRQWTYDDLMHLMMDKEVLIDWLMAEGLLGKLQLCPHCNKEMKLVTYNCYLLELPKSCQRTRHK